jgi:outer membrane protein TolC
MRSNRLPSFASGALVTVALHATIAASQPAQGGPRGPTEQAAANQAALDEPLLAAPSSARTEVASWQEARRLLAASSIDVGRADAAVARAAAQVRQAGAALLPSASLDVSGAIDMLHPGTAPGGAPSTVDRTPTSPLVTATATASMAVVDIAARRGRAAAMAEQRSASLTRLDVERRVTRDLAQAMLAVAAAERAAELNRLGLRQAIERAALTQRTFQIGAATDLDVVRIKQDVALARSAVIAGDDSLRVAREALGLLLGIDGEAGVARVLTGDQLLAGVAEQCRPLRDGDPRADLAAAVAAIESAELRSEQARAGYYPTLDLSTSVFAFTTDPGPGRVASWTAKLLLSLPLWEGGLREGLIAERRAAVAAAQVEAENARRTERVELARSRRGATVSRALVDAATESRTLAERVDVMTRRSFEIGRATSLEVVQSAGALRQAELTLTARQFELDAARIDELLTEARCNS